MLKRLTLKDAVFTLLFAMALFLISLWIGSYHGPKYEWGYLDSIHPLPIVAALFLAFTYTALLVGIWGIVKLIVVLVRQPTHQNRLPAPAKNGETGVWPPAPKPPHEQKCQ